jgi:hypothetical protein
MANIAVWLAECMLTANIKSTTRFVTSLFLVVQSKVGDNCLGSLTGKVRTSETSSDYDTTTTLFERALHHQHHFYEFEDVSQLQIGFERESFR